MRIIAGKAGRIAIHVPPAVTRPTTDFVRQALFSILGEKVIGARCLDLFAGSGAIGLEALSRGAASCVFVEESRQAVSAIRKNLAKTKLQGGHVAACQVLLHLRRDQGTYDLAFADPPYWKHHGDADHIGKLFACGDLGPKLAEDAWFVAEASSQQDPHQPEGWNFIDRRVYGNSALWFYRKEATE